MDGIKYEKKGFSYEVFLSAGVLSSGLLTCENGKNSSSSDSGLGLLGGLATNGLCTTLVADTSVACVLIPEETEGPYPLDLSSTPSFFRSDITEGKTGIPLTLNLTIVNGSGTCVPISNARVDVWHCDKDGYYSGYSGQSGYLGVKNYAGETFCRGIQLTDTDGKVSFASIYPGWYPGRVTHIHFQIYLNNGLIATSQIAFPEDITEAVYTTILYKDHGLNTSVSGNCGDMIFGNGGSDLSKELCTIAEDATNGGYIAELKVGIAV